MSQKKYEKLSREEMAKIVKTISHYEIKGGLEKVDLIRNKGKFCGRY